MFWQYLYVGGAIVFMVFFFGFCVFIHELGHFLAARWRGLHVDAFSIGFKKIWGFKRGGVEYRIGCIPFGGYVEIPQIDATGEAKAADGTVLPKAKPLDRMIAVFAGPLFNILFGLFLGLFIWWHGIPQDTPNMRSVTVAELDAASPEYKAGLRDGDEIVRINGESFNTTWNGVVRKLLFAVGDVVLDVRRDGKPLQIKYFPAVNKKFMPEEEIPYPFFRPVIPVVLYPDPHSFAEKAGILPGDRVLAFDGRPVYDLDAFESFLDDCGGKPVKLLVSRRGREIELPAFAPEPDRYQVGIGLGFDKNVVATAVFPGSSADAAGVKPGDQLLSVDGKTVNSPQDFISLVQACDGKALKVSVKRDAKDVNLLIVPRRIYKIPGVRYAFFDHPNPFEQFASACALTYKSLRGVFVGLGNKLGLTEKQSNLKVRHFSGPIGIANYLFRAVYFGSFIIGLNIVVIVTFNLGLVNLLPLPVLDGGHIVIAIYETIFGAPPPQKVLQPLTVAFIAFIISFMLFVSFYDVKRTLPWAFKSSDAGKTAAASVEAAKAVEAPPPAAPAPVPAEAK